MTLNGKTYSLKDSDRFIEAKGLSLKDGFYGGRVDKVCKTKDNGVYLCMEGMEPIDILVDEKVVTKDILVDIARTKRVAITSKATKDEIIGLLNRRV